MHAEQSDSPRSAKNATAIVVILGVLLLCILAVFDSWKSSESTSGASVGETESISPTATDASSTSRSTQASKSPKASRSTQASTSPETSTSTPTSTVSQWASAIAPLKADFVADQAKWDATGCSVTAAQTDVACATRLMSLGIQSFTIQVVLNALSDPDSTVYLGTAPDEISSLYDKTLAYANKAVDSSDQVDCPGDECASTGMTFMTDWDMLGDALTSWEPYL